MEISKFICEECGCKLKEDWIYCPKCSREVKVSVHIQCTRCYNIIEDQNPIHCPYCRKKMQQRITIIQKSSKNTFKRYLEHLRFNHEASLEIINHNRAILFGVFFILLSGFSYAFSIQFVSVGYNNTETQFLEFLGRFRSHIIILLLIGISISLMISLLKIETLRLFPIRLIGAYSVLFTLKDLIFITASVYIRFFNPNDNLLGFNQGTLTLIIHLFIFIHLISFIHKITPLGITNSLILVSIAYFQIIVFSALFLFYFIWKIRILKQARNRLKRRIRQWFLLNSPKFFSKWD